MVSLTPWNCFERNPGRPERAALASPALTPISRGMTVCRSRTHQRASQSHGGASHAYPLYRRAFPLNSTRRGWKFKFMEHDDRNRFAFVAKEKSRVGLDRRASNLAGVANPTSHDHQQVRSQCSKCLTHCACAGSNSRQPICRHCADTAGLGDFRFIR
jgi:hypothetical protein